MDLSLSLLQQQEPGRRPDPEPSGSRRLSGGRGGGAQRQKRRWMNKGSLLASDVRGGTSDAAYRPPGWHRTHHFPSLFDQGEHAQDVGLLRSPAHPACGTRDAVLAALAPPTCSLRPAPTSGLRRRTLQRPQRQTHRFTSKST